MSENCFINTISFMDFLQTFWQSYAWDVLILHFQYGNLTSLQLHCVILNDYLIETNHKAQTVYVKFIIIVSLIYFFNSESVVIFLYLSCSWALVKLICCITVGWISRSYFTHIFIAISLDFFFFVCVGNFKNLGDN